MSFIPPMLADTMPGSDQMDLEKRWSTFKITPGLYACEAKYDGHRIEIEVSDGITEPKSLFDEPAHPTKFVRNWSRDEKSRILPKHIVEAMQGFPNGIYDGELLVPGERSWGVTELTKLDKLAYVVFDILELQGDSQMHLSYDMRRAYLEGLFGPKHLGSSAVQLAESTNVDSMEDVRRICEEVWARGGEGVIVKLRAGLYHAGKRPKNNWLKIKNLLSAVLEVVGFLPSRGTKVDRGPYAMILLEDSECHKTQVKTKNDAECRRLEHAAMSPDAISLGHHPDLGRMLRVLFQERTPDGSYRHIRVDRWENE